MIGTQSDIEIDQDQDYYGETLTKLSFDSIKQNDLKLIFEVLSVSPENRTIADLDNLVKIMMHIEPIKKLQNLSAVFMLCRKMILSKFKTKDIIYEGYERAESLYIILNGKVAFYKKSAEYFENDQVVFLNSGSCFGKLYQWKIKFLPISVEESLLAIAPKIEVNKIPMLLSYERQIMLQQLKTSDIFCPQISPDLLQQVSKMLTLNKVPCGNFLIRQGQTPKALFYIMKGIVKKIICEHSKIIEVKRYSQSQYCPQKLMQPLDHDLIAQTPCQIVVIPKKVLKILNSPLLKVNQARLTPINIDRQLDRKKQWQKFKSNFMIQYTLKLKENKIHKNVSRWK